MTEEQNQAIGSFFQVVEELKRLGVIRTDRYLGDIAEFICSDELAVALADNTREPGHDGLIEGQKVQVKYHGGKATTVTCGDPSAYDELLVVLGPDSVIRPDHDRRQFMIYRIPSSLVTSKGSHADGQYRFTKNQLPQDCLVSSKGGT